MRVIIIFAVSILLVFFLTNSSSAFHSGGVGECEGCHSMHNSFGGSANVAPRSFAMGAGPYLLKANDASGVCLNCHQAADVMPSSYHISTAGIDPYNGSTPVEMTPGGDFAWLRKTMNMTVGGTAIPDGNLGERHGHNIISTDFGYTQDNVLTAAPGGTYLSANLSCISCHDPHGRYRRFADGSYGTTGQPIFGSGSHNNSDDPFPGISSAGSYRLLGGAGYQPKSLNGGVAFINNPPDAVVNADYNRSEATSQTGIAYGQGMSEWCVNCHTDMLQSQYTAGHATLPHPVGNSAKLTSEIVANYNSYISSGIITNVNPAAAFSTVVPFEIGSSDYSALKRYAITSDSYTNQNMPAASVTNNVMCLTCHRAHASGFDNALRFSYRSDFLTISDSAGNAVYDSSIADNNNNRGYSIEQQQNAYNGRPATVFSPYQRPLCEKCHISTP